ncbi:MAG: type IV pilus twitching motility protein PilT, partial [Firmicutes bacterium]|nr:type IV pilus twitching motility protein PilT [Bacillota bacterium]
MAEPLDGAVNATRRPDSTFLQGRVPDAGTQDPAAGEVAATGAAVAGAAANAAPLTVLPSHGHQSAAPSAPSTAVAAVAPPAPVLPPGWPAVADLLRRAVESRASDLHLVVGAPPTLRINGRLYPLADLPVLTPPVSEAILRPLAGEERWAAVLERGQKDFSYGVHGLGRFRINVYRQRGVYNAAMRVIPTDVPPWTELGLPAIFPHLADLGQGLILVTGATGSGKSTTLAALVDLINSTRSCHIITLEDPIEYLHHHKLSLVEQREIGGDTLSFADGLRAALREDPDVILVGEMRDLETISTAITAAETGHLVLATLHTNDAVQSVDRVVDVFPPYQQQQIRIQLAATLQAVISQQLLPRADGQGRVLAAEVLVATAAAQNLIREGKTH